MIFKMRAAGSRFHWSASITTYNTRGNQLIKRNSLFCLMIGWLCLWHCHITQEPMAQQSYLLHALGTKREEARVLQSPARTNLLPFLSLQDSRASSHTMGWGSRLEHTGFWGKHLTLTQTVFQESSWTDLNKIKLALVVPWRRMLNRWKKT